MTEPEAKVVKWKTEPAKSWNKAHEPTVRATEPVEYKCEPPEPDTK